MALSLFALLSFSGVVDTSFHDCYGLDRNGPEYQAVMDGFGKMHPIGRVAQVIIFFTHFFCASPFPSWFA